MKRILAVAVGLLLSYGAAASHAPFGLEWGQKISDVPFIDKSKCEIDEFETVCTFKDRTVLNEWAYSGELKFDESGLIEASNVIIGVKDYYPDFNNFKINLSKELKYLKSIGFEDNGIAEIIKLCSTLDTCDKATASSKTRYGTVEYISMKDPLTDSATAIVAYSK
ncbi:hypothetical protein HBA43_21140 [Providencia rettgeri]|uniref:hypothetical protein n=1 Tax=Providencia rettgeri TaxID=587 RepID=UPI001419BC94|nr:hypothetical protein [Providencia rettgeri]NIA76647.1 hypothetical protein [Providencia rettgeri]NIA80886.1 hypothetical protein [Providencia rettgeri]NIB04121.1 hypothetical protein [Providencia rettgeri]NIB08320.1 hypothetical protein [Providencia rettgeri]NIB21933.1 hypothetical protein [Providencia rettgeri]